MNLGVDKYIILGTTMSWIKSVEINNKPAFLAALKADQVVFKVTETKPDEKGSIYHTVCAIWNGREVNNIKVVNVPIAYTVGERKPDKKGVVANKLTPTFLIKEMDPVDGEIITIVNTKITDLIKTMPRYNVDPDSRPKITSIKTRHGAQAKKHKPGDPCDPQFKISIYNSEKTGTYPEIADLSKPLVNKTRPRITIDGQPVNLDNVWNALHRGATISGCLGFNSIVEHSMGISIAYKFLGKMFLQPSYSDTNNQFDEEFEGCETNDDNNEFEPMPTSTVGSSTSYTTTSSGSTTVAGDDNVFDD